MKKITVLGAGNGGLTAAYHFSKIGHEVCVYDSPKFPKQIEAIQKKGGIDALDEEHGCKMLLSVFSRISLATTDIREAMEFSDIFVMICPSFAQEIFFADMLPYISDGMKIMLMPGNYGGLVLYKALQESDKAGTDVTFMDAISIPWACRMLDDANITIMGLKEFLPLVYFLKIR